MAIKIGGYTLDQWQGQIPGWGNKVTTRERRGADGYTFVLDGKRSPVFEVRTVELVSSLSQARQREVDYAALEATFVVVEPPQGRSFSGVLVHKVFTEVQDVLLSTDGSSAKIMATWTMQRSR